jgi:hypothetical protein
MPRIVLLVLSSCALVAQTTDARIDPGLAYVCGQLDGVMLVAKRLIQAGVLKQNKGLNQLVIESDEAAQKYGCVAIKKNLHIKP